MSVFPGSTYTVQYINFQLHCTKTLYSGTVHTPSLHCTYTCSHLHLQIQPTGLFKGEVQISLISKQARQWVVIIWKILHTTVEELKHPLTNVSVHKLLGKVVILCGTPLSMEKDPLSQTWCKTQFPQSSTNTNIDSWFWPISRPKSFWSVSSYRNWFSFTRLSTIQCFQFGKLVPRLKMNGLEMLAQARQMTFKPFCNSFPQSCQHPQLKLCLAGPSSTLFFFFWCNHLFRK